MEPPEDGALALRFRLLPGPGPATPSPYLPLGEVVGAGQKRIDPWISYRAGEATSERLWRWHTCAL